MNRSSWMNHAVVLGTLALAACSASPEGTTTTAPAGAGSEGQTAQTAAAAPPKTEQARVADYLESLYARADVKHSFTSRLGDAIDCVDFASEPGVRDLVARGLSVSDVQTMMKDAEASHAQNANNANNGKNDRTAPRGDAYFNGDADESGNARACPDGSVPHVRLTPERIERSGGLDAYLAVVGRTHHAIPDAIVADTNPTSGGTTSDYAGYGHVYSRQTAPSGGYVQGGTATMTISEGNVNSAFIQSAANHVLSQIWVTGGSGAALQTLETGWMVDANVGGPYFWVGATADDYAHYCMNGQTTISGGTCVTWIPSNGSIALGSSLPFSTTGGAQHELTIQVGEWCTERFSLQGISLLCNYDVLAGVDGAALTMVGAFANSGYGSGLLGQGAGDTFEVGGEVFDEAGNAGVISMGEGSMLDGTASYGSTAYERNFGYYINFCRPELGGCNYNLVQNPATVYSTNSAFAYNTTAAAGSSSWTNWFYYGDYFRLIIIR